MLGEFLLVAAVTAAPNIEARVTTPDCTVRIESRIEEGHRPFYRLRPECALSRRSTAKAVEALQMQAPAQREISIAFGRIVDYPWLSILLAREASAAPGWDAARGRPRTPGRDSWTEPGLIVSAHRIEGAQSRRR